MEKMALTVDELMKTIGISRDKAYRLIHTEGFPAARIGKCIRIPVDDLRQWLSNQAQGGE